MHSWPMIVEIHVGDQQSLPPRFVGLNDDINSIEPVQRPRSRFRIAGKAHVGGVPSSIQC